jgi:hypothetical protein
MVYAMSCFHEATHEDYVVQYTAAADEALASGYLLQADYKEAIRASQDAPIPN